jgi:hypothetical protein
MRRFILVLAMCLVAVGASASYKIFLVSGETIIADEKPVVREGTVYFIKGGVTFTMPATRIDLEKSEKAALADAAVPGFEQIVTTSAPPPKTGKPVRVIKVDDESLDKIRQRSRLANEGELTTPETAEGTKATGGQGGDSGGQQGVSERDQILQRIDGLEQNLARAESNRSQISNDATDLKQRYDSSVQQEEKTALWSQYQSAQESLASASGQVDEAKAQLGAAMSDLMKSKPNVIEAPQGPQEPK